MLMWLLNTIGLQFQALFALSKVTPDKAKTTNERYAETSFGPGLAETMRMRK